MEIRVFDAIRDVPREAWDALVGDGSPFLEWDWLWALEAGQASATEWLTGVDVDSSGRVFVSGLYFGNSSLATPIPTALPFSGIPAGGTLEFWHKYGFDGGGTFPAVYTFPEVHGMITIDQRGSKSGRFDSSADNRDDVVFEVDTDPYGGSTQLRVISSATWNADIVDDAGRVGGEQFTLVGDLDNDGSDDMIWIGTTPFFL